MCVCVKKKKKSAWSNVKENGVTKMREKAGEKASCLVTRDGTSERTEGEEGIQNEEVEKCGVVFTSAGSSWSRCCRLHSRCTWNSQRRYRQQICCLSLVVVTGKSQKLLPVANWSHLNKHIYVAEHVFSMILF